MLFTFGAVAFDLLTFHSFILLICIFPCSTPKNTFISTREELSK